MPVLKLRDYQQDIAARGVAMLQRHRICLLLMQLRTGKTITSLTIANMMGVKNVLFLTKKNVITNVISDSEKINLKYKIEVTNYEQMDKYDPIFDLIIVDEFHSFGAFPKPTKRTLALKRLCANRYVIMLSGTPSPESYSQLFHPLWCVDFWPHKNFYSWAKDFVTVTKKYIYNLAKNDYSKADKDKITSLLAPITIHYTQEEAGFNIIVEDKVEVIPMPDPIRSSIKILRCDKIITTRDGYTILADTAVKLMSKVHQICSGTVKSEDGHVIPFNDFKAQYIKEKYEGKKIAIYYKYIGERELIENHFKFIATSDKHFNETDNNFIYLSQIQSGREGINLSSADFIIMYNIDYSSLSYIQVRERLNVKDRVKPGIVVWLFCEGGIEQKIYEKVRNKQDFTLSHFKKTI